MVNYMNGAALTDLLAPLSSRREQLGMSQAEVARLVGTTQTTVSTLERGVVDARLGTLREVARVLGMDVRLIPREILPAIDAQLQAFQRAGSNAGEEERPLYTLMDDDDDDDDQHHHEDDTDAQDDEV